MNMTLVAVILGALLTVSEALGGIPAFADNSIYQVVIRIFKVLYQTVTGKVPT
jgi:hypothetical protein